MTDREPNRLLRVHEDDDGRVTVFDAAGKRRDFWPRPDDLVPLPGPHLHAIGVGCDGCDNLWQAGHDTALAADEFASREPCDLGCTVECEWCQGYGTIEFDRDGQPWGVGCSHCGETGTVPAVHASEVECRPKLPDGWDIEMYEFMGEFCCDIGVRSEDGAWDSLWSSMYFHHEADRDAAIAAARRRIARQHKGTTDD